MDGSPNERGDPKAAPAAGRTGGYCVLPIVGKPEELPTIGNAISDFL